MCKKIICFLLFFVVAIISCTEKDVSLNKEKARSKFLEATRELNQLGGIASFDSPSSQLPFPKSEIRGLTSEQLNKILKKIIKDLKTAIELDPELREAYYFLGIAYVRLQDRDNAIEAFEKAIEIEPKRELSYIILCNLLWDARNHEEAMKIASQFLHIFPSKKIKGLLLVGTTYYKQGDFKKAVEKGNEIIYLDHKNIEGHLLLASSYYSIGDKETAEVEFKKIIEINPQMESEIEKLKDRIKKNN